MKIKKGDTVEIIKGKDKGRRGRVLKVFPKKNKLIVEGLNLLYRHTRPRREGEKGQRVQFSAPINISNVMLVCPKCHKKTRIGFRILNDGRKVRQCKKCKEIIS
ncbi:50S ribosomal protein L24 [bacterium]|nr:50S ribosomal protein L24 [bacterium]